MSVKCTKSILDRRLMEYLSKHYFMMINNKKDCVLRSHLVFVTNFWYMGLRSAKNGDFICKKSKVFWKKKAQHPTKIDSSIRLNAYQAKKSAIASQT